MVEKGQSGARANWPIEYYFISFSFVADALAILAWLGLSPGAISRAAVVATLGATGIAFSLVSLIMAVRTSLSVRGAFYPRKQVMFRLVASLLGVAVSFALLWFGIPRVLNASLDDQPSPSPVASPTR